MSMFDGITGFPDEFFDQVCSIEQGPTFATVTGMSALDCIIDPISGSSGFLLFALQSGATHTIHLKTHQPTIAHGMRAKVGTDYYPILRAFHNDGQFTQLIVKGTSADV